MRRQLKKHDIAQLPNLGPVSRTMLNGAGIYSLKDIERIGPVEAFVRVEEAGFSPSLNLLWGIVGALSGMPWEMIPPELKAELKKEVAVRRRR